VFFTNYQDAYDMGFAPETDILFAPGNVSCTQPVYSTAGAKSASLSMRIAGIADVTCCARSATHSRDVVG
jgi:hypothetical protein